MHGRWVAGQACGQKDFGGAAHAVSAPATPSRRLCRGLSPRRYKPLEGVYGRMSGSVHGFDYSSALRTARVVWSDDTLDRWLTDPDAFVPGNNMDFHVANPQERADLIRFLRDQSSR